MKSLSPQSAFFKRLLRNVLFGFAIIVVSLSIGMWGYSHYEGMNAVEAYVNAAMILSGMGPVSELHTDGGRVFAGSYALFSGIVFLAVIVIVFAPFVHLLFHKFHMEEPKPK